MTHKATRIAEVLAKERSVTPKVLGGLIEGMNAKTDQSINDKSVSDVDNLIRELQSTKVKLAAERKKIQRSQQKHGNSEDKSSKSSNGRPAVKGSRRWVTILSGPLN